MNTHTPETCAVCIHTEYDEFRHICIHESIDKNEELKKVYKLFTWPQWDYQMEEAKLIFSQDGKPRVICQMQIAGSTQGDTWEWSWGNPGTLEVCRSKMCVVHELGEQKQWERLTTLFLPNDEYVGWECAGVANHLLGGLGVYRCPTSDSKRTDGLVDAVYVVILSATFVQ
jgi:hypothetical protein